MTALTNVTINTAEVIDTRDIVELITEVEDKITELESDIEDIGDDEEAKLEYLESELDSYQTDLEILENIKEEVGSEFEHGESLIRDDYFTDYQKEMLIDCGMLPKDIPSFIENNIDWDAVADDLKVDYSDIEIEGETYWYRNC